MGLPSRDFLHKDIFAPLGDLELMTSVLLKVVKSRSVFLVHHLLGTKDSFRRPWTCSIKLNRSVNQSFKVSFKQLKKYLTRFYFGILTEGMYSTATIVFHQTMCLYLQLPMWVWTGVNRALLSYNRCMAKW